ncbi:MAG: carbon-nitrogen hydrolase family protein [Gemmatimonadota bacterium]|nr:MAG: carbon-nitrogen hydrolase family protein [Gemmatimonadota bacterium]
MRFAVCEAAPQMLHGDDEWLRLAELSKKQHPDVFLLNEMPFGRWVSAAPTPDRELLLASHSVHDHGLDHLADLGAAVVLGTRPTLEQERSVNQAFVWTAADGLKGVHTKQFFPDEPGYYEARWFERGEERFGIAHAGDIRLGFLTCTDVMFGEWARYYGRRGVHLIAVPRATPAPSLLRWKTMMSAAAIVSGCYVASSNRAGADESGQEFGGCGWIIDPTGQVRGETSAQSPVVTATIDVGLVKQAQAGYPSYVEDLPIEVVSQILERG